MRNFNLLVILAALSLAFSSCNKENFEPTEELAITPNKTLTTEYISLEEMNAALVEAGLNPVTLEELGLTAEEYQAAQERINDPNFDPIAFRDVCSASDFNVFLDWADINLSGTISVADVVRADQIMYDMIDVEDLTIQEQEAAANFGHISFNFYTEQYSSYLPNNKRYIERWDTRLVRRHILGTLDLLCAF